MQALWEWDLHRMQEVKTYRHFLECQKKMTMAGYVNAELQIQVNFAVTVVKRNLRQVGSVTAVN